mgnify:CR=1 FL=1
MRPDLDAGGGEMAREARRDVARRRYHARAAGKCFAEGAAPRRDVQRPLGRVAREARVAPVVVRLAAVAALAAIEVIARAERVRVVQRDVDRDLEVRSDRERDSYRIGSAWT